MCLLFLRVAPCWFLQHKSHVTLCSPARRTSNCFGKKHHEASKGKGSGFIQSLICSTSHSSRSGTAHSFTCKLRLTCPRLPVPRKRSPDGASPDWGCRHLIAAYYSFIYPERMKGWVGLLGWPTAERFTHLSGHPSAAGRAQDRESSPVKDRRSTTVPRNQP